MTTVPQLAQTLQCVFTTTADAAARATGFVQRRSKLSGAACVQALVFGWLADPPASLAALAQAAATGGVAIRPQGLDQRCTAAAAAFLEAVLGAAVQALSAAPPVASPLLQRFSAVLLFDGTSIVVPDALSLWGPGCGGSSATHTQAALKVGVRFDLCPGALRGPLLCDGRTHQRTTPLQRAPRPPRALRVAALGFVDLTAFAAVGAQQGSWLSRLHFGTAVYDADGRRWAVLDLLAAQGPAPGARPITLGAPQRLPARLLAVRVPQEIADQRRRRLRAAARDRGRAPSAARLAWCAWTLLVTHTPPALLTVRAALVLARARWQSELRFKLWTSHGHIDESRSAVGSPGACSARSTPSCWPWSSSIGSS
jgi:hypothetical protein